MELEKLRSEPDAKGLVDLLEAELAETNRGLVAIAVELGQRVEEQTQELRIAHQELQQTNSEVMRSALELEAANRELDAFAYSVSHDLRAPLRSINGFTRMLRDSYSETLDARGRDYLDRVHVACGRMSAMIEDLLKLSHVARCEIRTEPIDLGTIARDIAGALRESDPDRTVEFAIADNLVVNGDQGLLRAALENLLSNAWKFTSKVEQGRIEVGQSEEHSSYFVRDNGAGFDMTYAQQLFAPFKRLHREADFPGTGIGLATVQRIIGRHGGRIWADAELEKGATFYFTLRTSAPAPRSRAAAARVAR